MQMPSHVCKQVDLDTSVDAERTVVFRRIDQGSGFRQSVVDWARTRDNIFLAAHLPEE